MTQRRSTRTYRTWLGVCAAIALASSACDRNPVQARTDPAAAAAGPLASRTEPILDASRSVAQAGQDPPRPPLASGPATDIGADSAASATEGGSDQPREVALQPETGWSEAHSPGDQSASPVEDGRTATDALTAVTVADDDACNRPPPPPLPAPGTAGPERWAGFREPLPPTPLWNPPGIKRVGLQAGHWLVEQAPEELRRLQHGTSGGGKQEWEVNLDLARRARVLLQAAGVEVDILPTAVPPRY